MQKHVLSFTLALILILSLTPTAAASVPPSPKTASPTASTVYVNGTATAFEAYTIDGSNYFKLRDLALALRGTERQFEVAYDSGTMAITLTSGQAYTVVGGELAQGDGTAKTASPTASTIYLDGKELSLTVYIINGNNFFKLRDLMEAIGVSVGYDDATRNITLDTRPEPPVVEPPVVETDEILAYEQEVATLVNDIRVSYGLGALSVNEELCEIARLKSEDMQRNGYFDHTSPTYGTPFDMLASFGVSYRSAGENIAYGYRSPQEVVDGWMNSQGHRENILNASYTEIGVGYTDGHYWTQLFIG